MGMLLQPNKQGDFKSLDPGQYLARCVKIIDLGTQVTEYQGQEKQVRKIALGFEFPTELEEFKEGEGKKPFYMVKMYTASMADSSNLRGDVKAWLGKDPCDKGEEFDIETLLGIPCTVSVIKEKNKQGREVTKIISISGVPKGMTVPEQINESVVLFLDNFNEDVFNTLGDFFKEMISKSPEYEKAMSVKTEEIF